MRQTGVQGPEAGWGGPERGSSRSPLGRPGPYPRLIAGLALAVPFVIMPMPAQAQGNAQSAIERVFDKPGGLPVGLQGDLHRFEHNARAHQVATHPHRFRFQVVEGNPRVDSSRLAAGREKD